MMSLKSGLWEIDCEDGRGMELILMVSNIRLYYQRVCCCISLHQ
jgi:hypothetical protein